MTPRTGSARHAPVSTREVKNPKEMVVTPEDPKKMQIRLLASSFEIKEHAEIEGQMDKGPTNASEHHTGQDGTLQNIPSTHGNQIESISVRRPEEDVWSERNGMHHSWIGQRGVPAARLHWGGGARHHHRMPGPRTVDVPPSVARRVVPSIGQLQRRQQKCLGVGICTLASGGASFRESETKLPHSRPHTRRCRFVLFFFLFFCFLFVFSIRLLICFILFFFFLFSCLTIRCLMRSIHVSSFDDHDIIGHGCGI